MTVTKLQVDVLVQAAVYGPMGARGWSSLTKDPDELGRQLLSSGRRKSGERNGEDYIFAPLPIGLTALEIIWACRYFEYNRAKCPAAVHTIRSYAEGYLDGVKDTPWAWTAADVNARLDRPAPGSDAPAPPPPEVSVVADRLVALGLRSPKSSALVEERGRRLGGSAAFYGFTSGTINVPSSRGAPVVMVVAYVARTDEDAQRAFAALVHEVVWNSTSGGVVTEVRRTGNIVITAQVSDEVVSANLNEILDELGSADQAWSTNEAPVWAGEAELINGEVPMRLQHCAVATNKAELEALLEVVPDEEMKARLRAVDLEAQMVIAAPGLQVAAVSEVTVVRSTRNDSRGRPKLSEDLTLTYERLDRDPLAVGAVVLAARPNKVPDHLRAYTTFNTVPHYRRFVGAFTGWLARPGK